MKKQFGSFNQEKDGRLSGHIMRIDSVRKDGKYCVTHLFGSGKTIKKIYSEEKLKEEISKFFPGESI